MISVFLKEWMELYAVARRDCCPISWTNSEYILDLYSSHFIAVMVVYMRKEGISGDDFWGVVRALNCSIFFIIDKVVDEVADIGTLACKSKSLSALDEK